MTIYQEWQVSEGIKAKKYIVGNKETDLHTHEFYLRDDLPRATSSQTVITKTSHHAHSIVPGPDNTLVCEEALGHTHTLFTRVVNE